MTQVSEVAIFYGKVVDAQAKGDIQGEVAEEARGAGLDKPVHVQLGNKAKVGDETCLWKPVHGLHDVAKDELPALLVRLDEGGKAEGGEGLGGERVHVDFNRLGGGKRGTEIKIRGVG